jgi:hypothetical protein
MISTGRIDAQNNASQPLTFRSRKITNDAHKRGLIPTTTLKSSSNDLLIYFWKSNFLPGAKWAAMKPWRRVK